MDENTFSKEQLVSSERFYGCKDLLYALLGSGQYSIEQAENAVNQYLKGKVI